MVMIARETMYFINLRQAYLLAPQNATRISSRTVLFTDVPKTTLPRLRRMFQGVERMWEANDCHDLKKLIEDRDEMITKLEKAEIQLSKQANKKGRKTKHSEIENKDDTDRLIDSKTRPTHKLKRLIGKKVDTIEWASRELPALLEDIQKVQLKHRSKENTEFTGAVFVQFDTQRAAQTTFQSTTHESPLKMTPRCIGVPPNQVIWNNLGMNGYKRVIRGFIALGCIVLLIMFWSIPVAFVGALSNINYLTDRVPFLSFLERMPRVVLGVVTGLLPTLLLALLMHLVPVIFRSKLQEHLDIRYMVLTVF